MRDIKFNQNPSRGSRVVPCGRADTTKLIVAFRNFAKAPKNKEHAERLKLVKNCLQTYDCNRNVVTARWSTTGNATNPVEFLFILPPTINSLWIHIR
jgi:hypothetical protein